MSYERFQADLAPSWLQGPKGRSFNSALGASKDVLVQRIVAALAVATIRHADADALYHIGRARRLRRIPGESLEAYRARLLSAWDFWRWAGTVRGMTLAFEAAGYEVRIVEHYKTNMAIWAQFTVYLRAAAGVYTGRRWGEGWLWEDGTRWNVSLGALEPGRIMAIIGETKAAHAKPRNVYYFNGDFEYWGAAHAWGDGTLWGGNLFQVL